MNFDFDDHVFQKLAESLEDVFPEIIDVFFQETESAIHNIETKIHQQKWDEIKDIAHKIKSSSKTFGAMGLAKILEQMENQESIDSQQLFNFHKSINTEYALVKNHILTKTGKK